jgi:2-isopropylmalate synthase
MANRSTYEIMTPESIGIPARQMVLGKHSGRHAFEERLRELGFTLAAEELEDCFRRFKDSATARRMSQTATSMRSCATGSGRERFLQAEGFSVHAGDAENATAVISLEKDGEVREEVALGNGPWTQLQCRRQNHESPGIRL